MLQPNRRNLQIVRADRLSLPFERSADFSTFPGTRVIERQRVERREERVELRMFASRIGARFSAVAQFVDDHGTKNDAGDFRRLPAFDETGLFLTSSEMQVLVGIIIGSQCRRC